MSKNAFLYPNNSAFTESVHIPPCRRVTVLHTGFSPRGCDVRRWAGAECSWLRLPWERAQLLRRRHPTHPGNRRLLVGQGGRAGSLCTDTEDSAPESRCLKQEEPSYFTRQLAVSPPLEDEGAASCPTLSNRVLVSGRARGQPASRSQPPHPHK